MPGVRGLSVQSMQQNPRHWQRPFSSPRGVPHAPSLQDPHCLSCEAMKGVSVGSFSLFQERLCPVLFSGSHLFNHKTALPSIQTLNRRLHFRSRKTLGWGAGGAVSSGGRPEHFNTRTLTDCPRTSPPNRPTPCPTPRPCLPAPLHLLTPQSRTPPGLVCMGHWENSVREVGENSEPFPK